MLALCLALAALAADPWTDVAETAGMPVAEVQALAKGATKQDTILQRMARPWEARPWHEYHPILLTEERVTQGLSFWKENAESLRAAEERFGVPAHLVVAILGIESRYGEVMGADRVLDALFTLGFHHPRRGPFFRKELGHFLRLASDEGWTLEEPKGSYAGAMGMGQFIPSSYRNYAVDGDGDGRRDLFGSPADAIHSVANYFKVHGWKPGEAVLLPATTTDEAARPFVAPGLDLKHRWADLEGVVQVTAPPPAEAPARLFAFEQPDHTEYQVGLTNFYVITRYNRSALYARAVHELSEQLRAAYASP